MSELCSFSAEEDIVRRSGLILSLRYRYLIDLFALDVGDADDN